MRSPKCSSEETPGGTVSKTRLYRPPFGSPLRSLRVAQVAPYFEPHVGGVESHVMSVAEEQARRGHAVEVVTSAQPQAPAEETRDGYRVRRVPELANLFSTPITPKLVRVLAEGGYDIVHAHSPPPLTAWYAARACRRSGVPLVLTYHCDLEIPLPGGGLIVDLYQRTLGRSTVRAAAAVVATTRTYAQTSRMLWSRDDVDVVPNAIDAQRFTPGPVNDTLRRRHGLGDRKVALFVGRLAHHKGVEAFIEAARWTPSDVAHVVVGDGPKRAAFEKLARETAPGRVVFTGKLAARDLPKMYRLARVGVLPSNSRLEAFGIAALECMASGRPVIVSAIPGVDEVIEDGVTGLLAEPLDAKDLGRKIARLADDESLAETMGKAGRQRVLERFTIGRVVDALDDVYARVLKEAA